jgi:hypothetical protein
VKCDTLPVVFRDFKPLHTDFGCHMNGNGARPGLVLQNIGGDNKPVYNPQPAAAAARLERVGPADHLGEQLQRLVQHEERHQLRDRQRIAADGDHAGDLQLLEQ